MFSFFKKKITIESSGILKGFTDFHSHILPGVDDGVKTMEETLNILSEYEKLGIEEVWCTPHIMEDIPNTTEKLKELFQILLKNYDGPIKLNLAAEYMVDNLFAERLSKGDLLYIGHKQNELLIETSYYNPPLHFEAILDSIMSKGIYPVLAHPERYMYMNDDYYYKLKQKQVRFQLNLGSLGAAYGHHACNNANMLLEKDLYDYKGTDLHSIRFIDFIKSIKCPKALIQ